MLKFILNVQRQKSRLAMGTVDHSLPICAKDLFAYAVPICVRDYIMYYILYTYNKI